MCWRDACGTRPTPPQLSGVVDPVDLCDSGRVGGGGGKEWLRNVSGTMLSLPAVFCAEFCATHLDPTLVGHDSSAGYRGPAGDRRPREVKNSGSGYARCKAGGFLCPDFRQTQHEQHRGVGTVATTSPIPTGNRANMNTVLKMLSEEQGAWDTDYWQFHLLRAEIDGSEWWFSGSLRLIP